MKATKTELGFTTIPKPDLQKLLAEAYFNPNVEPPQEVVVWRIESQNVGSLGNFSLITGLPKAGKGKYLSAITAAALTRNEIFGQWVKLPPEKKALRYWDTEQSKYDHYNMLGTIRQMMEADEFPGHFKSYHCRKHDPQQIIPMIEFDLSLSPDIGIVILDGLLDLIDSFNDEVQSKQLVNFLKRITDVYGILVIAVLHRSKSQDRSMGHLGSAADRAAQSVLKVEKNKELKHYILSAEFLRNGDDFNPIAIYYNRAMQQWEQTDYIKEVAQEKPQRMSKPKPGDLDLSVHTLNVLRIFNSNGLQSYYELAQNIVEQYAVGMNWAKDCIKHLKDELKLIYKSEAGYTNVQQARLLIQK